MATRRLRGELSTTRNDEPQAAQPPPPPPPSPPIVFTNNQISDVVLSADGLRAYTVNSFNGEIQVFRAETGALITTWDAGNILNFADLSLDGRYMLASGYQVLGGTPGGPDSQTVSILATYRVDLATGQITQLLYEAHGYDRQFGDVAWLDTGMVMITMGAPNAGGQAGYGQVRLLDPTSGQYSTLNINYAGNLLGSADGNRVMSPLVGGATPSVLYDAEDGIIASNATATLGLVTAYSREAGLIVNHQHGSGLTVYNSNLQFQAQLTQHNPQFAHDIEALAFDETGQFLFLLDQARDSIHQLRVSDWSVVQTIALGVAITYDINSPANWLQIAPDMRYFLVMKDQGVFRVDNPLVADAIVGTLGNDSLNGTAGNDTLIGDSGVDVMTGGAGDDIYYVDNPGDVVVEAVGGGSDTVRAGISYALAAGLEIERLETTSRYGTQALDLFGNDLANAIHGNNGANVLLGGGGNDILAGLGGNDYLDGDAGGDGMSGGAGNDIYWVDSTGDSVNEALGEGYDTVFARTTYGLTQASEIEVLAAGTGVAIDLTGNDLANAIYGNDSANVLLGAGGNDVLAGFGGNDYLDGGTGGDGMSGGAGDEIYWVDGFSDSVNEAVDEGYDVVFARASYALTQGAEVEILAAGTGVAIDLTGNELANAIYGNDAANVLLGAGGTDVLASFGGNDYLDGGSGGNGMWGGAGDDVYWVEGFSDSVNETAGEGNDTVYARASYALTQGSAVEVLAAGVGSAIDLTGNDLANAVYGNEAANTLLGAGGNDVLGGFGGNDYIDGGTGADVMSGGGGNDVLWVDVAGDVVNEAAGEGYDIVYARVSYALTAGSEIEMLTAGVGTAIDLTGNALANQLYGNEAGNVLSGGGGDDVLGGFGGADTYAFTTTLGDGNIDLLLGFQTAVDKIALDDAVFAALAPGALAAGAFVIGSAAADADDRIVYNSATGVLLFDADGNGAGAAIQFAILDGVPALAASDFLVI